MTGEVVKFSQITTDNGRPGILATELYRNLGGAPANYARWVDRNIVKNPYLVQGVDFIEIAETSDVQNFSSDGRTRKPGRPRRREKDYILSYDAARKVSLSTKTPKQSEIAAAISRLSEKPKTSVMIPTDRLGEMIQELIRQELARQNGMTDYNQLMLENKTKDKTIESLALTGKAKKNAIDAQATIRQIVNIVATNSWWGSQPNGRQAIYHKIMADYFNRHPVRWRSDWAMLKNKDRWAEEQERLKQETGEKPMSKLTWIRLTHPEALNGIVETARNYAVFILPIEFWQNGGKLPA